MILHTIIPPEQIFPGRAKTPHTNTRSCITVIYKE